MRVTDRDAMRSTKPPPRQRINQSTNKAPPTVINALGLQANKVELPGRPAVHYDALTIDVGITPAATAVHGAIQFSTPVKPISTCAINTPGTLLDVSKIKLTRFANQDPSIEALIWHLICVRVCLCRFVARINELRDRINASEKPMRVRSRAQTCAQICTKRTKLTLVCRQHVRWCYPMHLTFHKDVHDAMPVQIAVVGGGPGGVELALALQHRLHEDRMAAGRSEDSAPDIK